MRSGKRFAPKTAAVLEQIESSDGTPTAYRRSHMAHRTAPELPAEIARFLDDSTEAATTR
jgi:hypothetical protein